MSETQTSPQQQDSATTTTPVQNQEKVVEATGPTTRVVLADRYKTKICEKFQEKGKCPYDRKCMFAHGEHELRTYEMNIMDGLTTEENIRQFRRMQRADFQRFLARQEKMQFEKLHGGNGGSGANSEGVIPPAQYYQGAPPPAPLPHPTGNTRSSVRSSTPTGPAAGKINSSRANSETGSRHGTSEVQSTTGSEQGMMGESSTPVQQRPGSAQQQQQQMQPQYPQHQQYQPQNTQQWVQQQQQQQQPHQYNQYYQQQQQQYGGHQQQGQGGYGYPSYNQQQQQQQAMMTQQPQHQYERYQQQHHYQQQNNMQQQQYQQQAPPYGGGYMPPQQQGQYGNNSTNQQYQAQQQGYSAPTYSSFQQPQQNGGYNNYQYQGQVQEARPSASQHQSQDYDAPSARVATPVRSNSEAGDFASSQEESQLEGSGRPGHARRGSRGSSTGSGYRFDPYKSAAVDQQYLRHQRPSVSSQ